MERDSMVQGVCSGNGSDQDEHDQAHSLLPVVGAMKETHASTGEDEQAANVKRRRSIALRGTIELLIFNQSTCGEQQQSGNTQSDHRRQQQRPPDVSGLSPVDTRSSASSRNQLICDSNSDD